MSNRPRPATVLRPVLLAVLLASGAGPISAQCLPPLLSGSSDCPAGHLVATFTAAQDYDSVILRVVDPGTMSIVDAIGALSVSMGEILDLAVLVPSGTYTIEADVTCPAGSASESVGFMHTCPPVSLTTSLAFPVPGETSSVRIELLEDDDRALGVTQTWSGAAFDLSGHAPGAFAGTITVDGSTGTELTIDLTVAAASATSIDIDCTVVSVSPAFLGLLTSLGGSDPTGSVVGSISIATAGPSGGSIVIDAPDPFPPGSTWVPTTHRNTSIHFAIPFVVLTFGFTTIEVDSELSAVLGAPVLRTEQIPVGSSSLDYTPALVTQLATTATGATSTFVQTITDPIGERITVGHQSEFLAGAFGLASFANGQTCGSWQLEVLIPNALSGSIVVSSPGPDAMTAEMIVAMVDPVMLSFFLAFGMPDPTGTALFTIEYMNLLGGGARVERGDQALIPPGTPILILSDFVLTIDHQVGLSLPGAPGDLTLETGLVSQLGEIAGLTEVFAIGASPEPQFERGDCNGDGGYDIGDAIFTLSVLFGGGSTVAQCADSCDSNDDGANDIGDAIFSLGALFSGGPQPAPPGAACGPDPSTDPLACGAYPLCP